MWIDLKPPSVVTWIPSEAHSNLSLFQRWGSPNDINEAVSSLISALSRLGDLPELPVIKKLFGERYGKKFEITALELLPGNHVSYQVCPHFTKNFFLGANYRIVDEIARICFQHGPSLLEYRNGSQQKQVHETIDDAQIGYKKTGEMRLKNSNIATEANIASVDYSLVIEQASMDSVHCLKNNEQESISNSAWPSDSSQSTISTPEPVIKRDSWRTKAFVLGEKTDQLAKEMTYLDDTEEVESILIEDLNFQD